MGGLICLLAAVVLPIGWMIAIHNRIIALRNHLRNAWAQIDTELKRRHDLIPNLVETVKAYATHERDLFERIAEARNLAESDRVRPGVHTQNEKQVTQDLGRLMAVSEAYPDLKASEHFLRLQEELVETEDRIQLARRFYNGNVRDWNTLIESFPSMLVARAQGCEAENYFDVNRVVVSSVPEVNWKD
mgnify:CR=1 FL=1